MMATLEPMARQAIDPRQITSNGARDRRLARHRDRAALRREMREMDQLIEALLGDDEQS
jgi:hypothetical protein